MNEIQTYSNPTFGEIRTVTINDEPWFVGKDVAQVLGYAKPENALAAHVDEEDKTTTLIQGTGSNYKSKAIIINESGLYSLILSSKLPNAKAFKRWVTSEVLPSIRKTGSYFGGSKELQAIFMLDNRTVEHEQRITALEDNMTIDYGQQRTLATQVNTVVVSALGGKDSAAYNDKSIRDKAYSECNRDIQRWFRVNSRNNIPRKRFDEAVEYIQRWHPSTNMAMTIQHTNKQEGLFV